LLNYIAIDNNKNLEFNDDNINKLMNLIKKIRSFNQFGDQIKITFTNNQKIENIYDTI
jgi:hypothetical protein